MAEDFAAQPTSPQIACLTGVRQSAAVVLIIGDRYGQKQSASGLSPTHEEFQEAKTSRPVFVFVQEGVIRDSEEETFAQEVQGWAGGYFRAGFRSADELRSLVTRALHNWEVSSAAAPVDPQTLLAKAMAAVPKERPGYSGGERCLALAIISGPEQTILRPAKIEDAALANAIRRDALYGSHPIFDPEKGTQVALSGDTLVVSQSSSIDLRLAPNGGLVLRAPMAKPKDAGLSASMVLYEEDIRELARRCLHFAADLLDSIDQTQRLTQVAIAATLINTGMVAWRARGDHFDGSMRAKSFGSDDSAKTVHLSPPIRPRAALRHQANELAEDLVTLLKRQSQWE